MQYNDLAIPRHDDVGLDVIGALRLRQRLGRERMFGQISARATVRDHQLAFPVCDPALADHDTAVNCGNAAAQ